MLQKLLCNKPGVEIGMLPVTEDGRSGFQFCNLTEINGAMCTSPEKFFEACESAAILGTIQAGYTNFQYVSDATREITQREALIGVSVTGWLNNPHVLFDTQTMRKGAEIVKETNARVAAMLGINRAARTTCVKPSGNASVLLGTASGIHAEHSPMYFRHVQMTMRDEVAQVLAEQFPKMIERRADSSDEESIVACFPITAPAHSVFRKEAMGVAQLEYVRLAQQNWIEAGTVPELCRDKRLRHNVSNTITVDNWDEVEEYLFANRQWFAGVSLLPTYGDKAFAQAPFTEVRTAQDILETYGDASLFASGLIVDGMHAFDNNLWRACATAQGVGEKLTEESRDLLKRDWVRRFNKFAVNFFGGDTGRAADCLKDCHNLHKWNGIQRQMREIDISALLHTQKQATDINELGAQACAGGACEITF